MTQDLFYNVQDIAIIRRNGLGDLLCAMPLVAYCRQQAPDSTITLFVDRRNAPLTPYLRGFDDVHVFMRGNKYLAACWAGLRACKDFDIAIAAKPTPMKLMNFSVWTLGARKRVTVAGTGLTKHLVNYAQQQRKEGSCHQALAILQLVAPHLTEIPTDLYPRLYVDAIKGKNPLPVLFVSLTNNREASTLGVEGHLHILNALAKHMEFSVLISCEPKDVFKAQALSQLLKVPSEVRPSYSLDDLLKLLASCDMVLVGDGGIMHLAAALDKPQVVLFGRPITTQWHPLSQKAVWHVAKSHVRDIDQEMIVNSLLAISRTI